MEEQRRDAMEIIPGVLSRLWNDWQLRAMVLLSLLLQIILVILGNRRKHTANILLRIIIWTAYLSADSITTISIGILSNNLGDSSTPQKALTAFWAPFLLLHLGGPDTITAYSLEDNELWLRYLLGLLAQVPLVLYILLRSWNDESVAFTLISIPIFITGSIKYVERTWALRSASSSYIENSLSSYPDSTPDVENTLLDLEKHVSSHMDADATYLQKAYVLFDVTRQLYVGSPLNSYQRSREALIEMKSASDSFKLVELALGFMYDVLYTKANVIYSRLGVVLRFICLISSISVFIFFMIFVDPHGYSSIDMTITYVLLVGAIGLEVYSVFELVFSNWAKLWLIQFKRPWANRAYQSLSSFRLVLKTDKKSTMGQFNLVDYCLEKDNLTSKYIKGVLNLIGAYEILENNLFVKQENLDIELKELVFRQISGKDPTRDSKVVPKNGGVTIYRKKIIDTEFIEDILRWHIATEQCYYLDLNNENPNLEEVRSRSKIGRKLSYYMLYLLVMRPSLLPKSVRKTILRDTCEEASKLMKEGKGYYDCRRGRMILASNKVETALSLHFKLGYFFQKDNTSVSILRQGSKLAYELQTLVDYWNWNDEEKWELIGEVWIEMVCFAASQCGWEEHAQQLRRGGELLTYVRLLMEHCGFPEEFLILYHCG